MRLALPLCFKVVSRERLLVLLTLVAVQAPGKDPLSNPSLKRKALAAAPVPLRATVWGLPGALSAIEMLAVRLPVAVGVKVALMLQLALTASVLGLSGHVLLELKSPALVPLRVMLLMVSGAVPVLVRVTDCVPLVVLTV